MLKQGRNPGALKFVIFLLLAISCSYGTTKDYGRPETNRAIQEMAGKDNYLRMFSLRGQNSDGSDDFSTLAETNKRNVPCADGYITKDEACSIITEIIREIKKFQNAPSKTLRKICRMGEICSCNHSNCGECKRVRGRKM